MAEFCPSTEVFWITIHLMIIKICRIISCLVTRVIGHIRGIQYSFKDKELVKGHSNCLVTPAYYLLLPEINLKN
jgi:hypothetical protein